MTTVSLKIGTQGLDWLAPSTREALRIAQQEAGRLQTGEVTPEILFLAVLMQAHDEVRRVLSDLGMNLQIIRAQAVQTFGMPAMPRNAEAEQPHDGLPLSKEVQSCIDWAIAFATDMHAPLILPGHLLLGTLRHQRTQPLLSLLLPDEGVIPAPVMESTGHNYTRAVDQFIRSRVREWSLVSLSSERNRQILRGFERPTVLFTDITGEDAPKRALQEAVDFLRIPALARSQEQSPLYGGVLVGSPRRNRTLLVRAVAGEAVVPLFSLSLSTLAGMLSDIANGSTQLEDLELSEEERTLLAGEAIVLRGRRMIAYVFEQARNASPCVLLLDNIEAINRLSKEEERQQWLNQLLVEMDRREDQPPMVVIAATEHPASLDQALLHPARLQRRIVLEDSMFAQTRPCPSCRHTTQPGWKRCMYCGTLLTRVCPHCNVLLPEITGVRFCFECGGPLK
ncbi:MAG TPA: AAA family ATPase [Ktedonobacteraceae bacterium]|nr:AAA family ATPase [Ktedonobacteraceae bacterium]